MALEAKANLEDAYYLIGNYQEKQFQFIAQREDIIDKYEDKLGSYLIKLTGKELSEQQNKDVTKFLHAIGDVERIGDHAMNIAECAKEIAEKNIVFSEEATRELNTMFAAVQEITYNCHHRLHHRRPGTGLPDRAPGGAHRLPVRRDEAPPRGPAPAGDLPAHPGLRLQRPSDQL